MTGGTKFFHITHPRYLLHDTGGEEHPDTPERLKVIATALADFDAICTASTVVAIPAPKKWLQTVHTENYLLRFEETALSGGSYLGHPDNQLCYETYEIAILAAGAGLTGIDLLEKEPGSRIFCSVRPPGHHAEEAVALGFCFLNNTAIAARYWQEKYFRRRIAIIDFDAHHGNGIQNAFEEDPDILYVSTHEHPTFSFPGTGYAEETGTGPGKGTTLNIPLLPGAGDAEVKKALAEQIVPALEKFRPEALLIAAGFDGHQLDDMSGLSFSTQLYNHLGRTIAALGRDLCSGRVVSILEGGYQLPSLSASVKEYCRGIIEHTE
ncbi:MAG: histone deacetylase [Proteobacteria bacterium]|nr:histone deacetylase [Pseudomonadota bacterium]MBU1708517.1 histone deacetylase [Pseudomonadota bacterium]